LGVVARGETLRVFHAGRDGFCRVDYQGRSGYVASVYVARQDAGLREVWELLLLRLLQLEAGLVVLYLFGVSGWC
jgi:hypothetical protein